MILFSALLLLVSATLALAAVRRVPADQVHSVYRRGKPARLLHAGVHVVVPGLDRVAHKIQLSGQTLRFQEPRVDAHDVRGTVYWQVLEPERADAVFAQVAQLIRRGAREALDGARVADPNDRSALGARLKQALNSALRERGMLVTRVELDAV
jgi:hypothetical protein